MEDDPSLNPSIPVHMSPLMMSGSFTGVARNVETTGIGDIEASEPGFEAVFGN
ncbi:hypothetical protein Scep_016184 [Stephania cephalantha]|uniref:Uncharacterized protein n=1 Tax=Stephania cephalantha TaxID=152367 RepID=A0AAP0NVJ3_9MAGN